MIGDRASACRVEVRSFIRGNYQSVCIQGSSKADSNMGEGDKKAYTV